MNQPVILPGGNAETPLDLESLLKDIQTRDGIILEKDDIIQKKSIVIDEQKNVSSFWKNTCVWNVPVFYGRSSEKFTGEGEIFNEAELARIFHNSTTTG